MAIGSNSVSTLFYHGPLSEKSNMRSNRNKTYTNDDKVNQYVLQNTLELTHTMTINFQ